MTRTSLEELMEAVRPRYVRARRMEKGRILDEFVAITGYHRKSAIRLLNHGRKPRSWDKRGRPRVYTNEVKSALIQVWEICGLICSRRLHPFLPEVVEVLERAGELRLSEETKRLLFTMSRATIDRLLRSRRYQRPHGRCTTKPGTLLKQSIPVRTFADWDDARPGFVEMDLVAHCGGSTRGEYIHTLDTVDVTTGWCELLALPNRSQQAVSEGITKLREQLPFPLLGIDSDNDSAFLNHNLYRYCKDEKITFTRCRVYKKNDQAHIEQKNWTVVRRLIGYDRYEPKEALALLRAIYADWRLYMNFFQPVMKLVEKQRDGSKVRKRYDEAHTPYKRVLAAQEVAEEGKERLREMYQTLNPVAIRRRVDQNLKKLWRLRG